MADVVEGGCLCGAVRYRIAGAAFDRTNCHCTMCRRASAAPFVAWVTVHASDFRFTAGVPARYASSPRAVRTFCGTCGTPLTFQLVAAPDALDVTVCSLDDPERLPPDDHTWTATRLSWVKLADGLPQHAGPRP